MIYRLFFSENRFEFMCAVISLLILLPIVLMITGCTNPVDGEKKANETVTINISTEIPKSPINEVIPATSCPIQNNNSMTVALGDTLTISNFSPNSGVTIARIWVFGEDTLEITNISVSEDGSFNYSLNGERTKNRSPGKYRIIIQYPKIGDVFNINPRLNEDRLGVFDPEGHLLFSIRSIHDKKINGLTAAGILEREIMKPGNTDAITNLTLIMEVPRIQINPVGNHTIGDKFTLNGTTNLAAGDALSWNIYPVDYYLPLNSRDFLPPMVRVNKSLCGNNSWSFDIDSSTFSSGEYRVRIDAVMQSGSIDQRFYMIAPLNLT